ncbi:FlhC family transcriptional regulator [Paraburkholderia rhizosphaerae]|uniref:Transcriptional activator FlhC n=1 Tax=Paraburkholderia rhizosphaerae TaxID=480658 RepID=A0A4R8LPN1_9BURK|nr:FlhC family transcriptional regulator [Paraburkholderia rhizosphaerae]TDY48278.1 transcriptional activator FlhC [Paraburkholderia rhizosphaerae]
MHKKEDYQAIERLYVPDWLISQIQGTNFDLVDHMKSLLQQDGRFNEVFTVERKEIDHFKHNQTSLRSLLRTPFLMVSPTLQTVEDWRCFVDDTATTVAVDELRRKIPPLDSMSAQAIQFTNRRFLDLVTGLVNMSVLAAPLLGISTELAMYLQKLQPYRLRMALGRMQRLPLFRWRFNSATFWYEFTGNTLTDEMIAHHIMLTSPERTGHLPNLAGWADLRLERAKNETFADAMMAYGCRASTAATLFRLNQNALRRRYVVINGESSKCGNSVNSVSWCVDNPHNRLHATTYTWLYRSAMAMGANAPEALIATNDIYGKLFDTRPLSADRGVHITRSMAADTRMAVAPCRSCGTHYVVSNTETKIEMHSSFVCPACTQQLGPRRRKTRRNAGGNDE